MKKKRSPDDSDKPGDDMLPEYGFDYSKAKPNRFTEDAKPGSRAVFLDADVAAVFTSTDAVNAVLRALITTMPKPSGKS